MTPATKSFYRFSYRHGRPPWDSAEPHPELLDRVAGRRPGRALDLGCGTGTDAIWLATRGWEVVAVDFVPEAIEKARSRTVGGGPPPRFVVGDVTRLRHAGVEGPFDLVTDTGCFHAIAAGLRPGYATEVAAVAAPGADFFVAGIADPPAIWRLLGARGLSTGDLLRHFGAAFDLDGGQPAGVSSHATPFVMYHLVRKQGDPL